MKNFQFFLLDDDSNKWTGNDTTNLASIAEENENNA